MSASSEPLDWEQCAKVIAALQDVIWRTENALAPTVEFKFELDGHGVIVRAKKGGGRGIKYESSRVVSWEQLLSSRQPRFTLQQNVDYLKRLLTTPTTQA